MCRMLAASGSDLRDVALALRALRGQAQRSATGPETDRSHPHGWGVVAARDGAVASLARRPHNAADDAAFETLLERLEDQPSRTLFVAHVRNASVGSPSEENTHPFVREGWAFCHNGTIHDAKRIEVAGATYEGATDSERFFVLFLEELRTAKDPVVALSRTVAKIDERCGYSSLTCLLTDGRTLLGYRRLGDDVSDCGSVQCAAEYYTLGVGRLGSAFVVAQEPTYLGNVRDWRPIADGAVLVWPIGGAPRIQGLVSTRPDAAGSRMAPLPAT